MMRSRPACSRWALVAAVALLAGSTPPTRAGAAQSNGSPLRDASSDSADESEHDDDRSPEIRISWIQPARSWPARLDAPRLHLDLLGLRVDAALDVEVRTIEDAGTQQSRRVSQPLRDRLVAPYRLQLPITFAERLPVDMTHSGMVVAVVRACDAAGRCLTGTSEPLFFHLDEAGYVVYDEQALCRDFQCGDLRGASSQERGTWRVMGGGPLHSVTSREEPAQDDDVVVDGGDV